MHPITALSILLILSPIIPLISSRSVRPVLTPGLLPDCWQHDDSPVFQPLVFKDCLDIIRHEIGRGLDPEIPLKFSRLPSLRPDIKLPVYWIGTGTAKCTVSIDVTKNGEGYDRTTFNDIKVAALRLARDCVIPGPHLGGVMKVGWRDMLGVAVAGVLRTENRTRVVDIE